MWPATEAPVLGQIDGCCGSVEGHSRHDNQAENGDRACKFTTTSYMLRSLELDTWTFCLLQLTVVV